MHIHVVISQDEGQLASPYVLKENNWGSILHLQQPLFAEQGFCQYNISVFMFTLRTHLFGMAEHNAHLTIHSFPFIPLSAACMTLSHTFMLQA